MRVVVRKMWNFMKRHLVMTSLLASGVASALVMFGCVVIPYAMEGERIYEDEGMFFFLMAWGIFAAFICYPVVLTIMHVIFLFHEPKSQEAIDAEKILVWITALLGATYSMLAVGFMGIVWVDWQEQIYVGESHTPIALDSCPTLFVFLVIGMIGLLWLQHINVKKAPPLMPVIAIAMIYVGIVESALWIVQTLPSFENFGFAITGYIVNMYLISVKLIRRKILAYQNKDGEGRRFCNPHLQWANRFLTNSTYWPIVAFVLMLPLVAIVICILMLFGQRPDALIRVWSETSDWTFSLRQAPEALPQDGHYLCTVAARGHEKLVHPLRSGERHGHVVIVNRQLCVANAFEQILEERTPGLHRQVRHFYDTCGLPVARLIKSPVAADIVYLLMKPLEWCFLLVLYLCDVEPERRIATQYLPQKK